jgi:hypothetical protein
VSRVTNSDGINYNDHTHKKRSIAEVNIVQNDRTQPQQQQQTYRTKPHGSNKRPKRDYSNAICKICNKSGHTTNFHIKNNLPGSWSSTTKLPQAEASLVEQNLNTTSSSEDSNNDTEDEAIHEAYIVDLADQWSPLIDGVELKDPQVLEANYTNKKLRHTVWGFDTCASLHLTGDQNLLTDIKDTEPRQVRVANGQLMTTTKSGTAKLHIRVKSGEYKALTLKDVHLVPNMCRNLISVGLLVEDGYTVTLDEAHAKVFNVNGTPAGRFKRRNNIYIGKALRYAKRNLSN